MNFYEAIHPITAPLTRAIYRPRVVNAERLPRSGAYIIASNHLSFADNVLLPAVFRRPARFILKSEYTEGRGLRGRLAAFLYRSAGFIPVQRSGDGRGERNAEALDRAAQVLADGGVIVIYPEGTRSRDGRLQPGKSGAVRLAVRSGVPVVPVGIRGTDLMQPIGRRLPRPAAVTVSIGLPVTFSTGQDQPSPSERATMTHELMTTIQQLSGQERAETWAR